MDTLIRFDWYMKRMLRDKANYVILEGLLTVLLGRPIKIKTFLESEGNQENEADKFNRVDLLAEDTDGELMIFKIQNSRELDYFHRMSYGVTKTMSEYINQSQCYGKVSKAYSINIFYFDLRRHDKDYVYHGSVDPTNPGRTELIGLHDPSDILQISQRQRDKFRWEIPAGIPLEYYIIKADNFDSVDLIDPPTVSTTPLNEWIKFLKTGKIAANTSVPGLGEARERMRIDNLSDEEQRAYNRHWENVRYQRSMLLERYEEGFEKGFAEGKRKRVALDVAEKMKQAGIPLGQIVRMTGLAIEDVEGL